LAQAILDQVWGKEDRSFCCAARLGGQAEGRPRLVPAAVPQPWALAARYA